MAPGGRDSGVTVDMDKFEAWWQKCHQQPHFPENMPGSNPEFPGHDDVNQALQLLSSWFPEGEPGSEFLRQNIPAVIECFCDHKGRPPHVPESWNGVCPGVSERHWEPLSFIDPCTDAVLFVIVDIVSFVLGLAGVRTAGHEYLSNSLVRDLVEVLGGDPTLVAVRINGLRIMINELRDARGTWETAKAIAKIAFAFNRLGGVKLIVRNLLSRMSWWEWVKSATIMTFVMIAWLGSEGTVLVAEVALAGMALEQLVEDSLRLVEECGSGSGPEPHFSTMPVPGPKEKS